MSVASKMSLWSTDVESKGQKYARKKTNWHQRRPCLSQFEHVAPSCAVARVSPSLLLYSLTEYIIHMFYVYVQHQRLMYRCNQPRWFASFEQGDVSIAHLSCKPLIKLRHLTEDKRSSLL